MLVAQWIRGFNEALTAKRDRREEGRVHKGDCDCLQERNEYKSGELLQILR